MVLFKIVKYVIYDVVRSRMVLGYCFLLLALSYSFFYMDADTERATVSLLNVMLLLVPLAAVIFGTIHLYNAREFVEMLLAQPVSRSLVFCSEYLGMSLSLASAWLVGAGLPVAISNAGINAWLLLAIGTLLTFIFTALAFFSAVMTNDKAKGIGLSLLLWLYFSLLFDGLVLLALLYFSNYPLEKPMLLLSALNPVDVARIFMLLRLDIAALMGFTGAVFEEFLGSENGLITAFALLLFWVALPFAVTLRLFRRKDL